MAVTPDDLLASADVLLGGDRASEVDWRNATSRAYYADYHRCRSVAGNAGLSIARGGSVHAELVGELTAPLSPNSLKSLGYMLDQCRRRRSEADYNIDGDFERVDAEWVVEECRRITAKGGCALGICILVPATIKREPSTASLVARA